MNLPQIIQGGMGVGISDWRLARSVASQGQMGVVSGTGLDVVLIRRLQVGDLDGDMRRAIAAFPDQDIANRILDRYFVPGGKPADQPFATKPMVGDQPGRRLEELLVVANFVEVFLAMEGHDGMVGINFLHKIQAPLMASLYGAMLAGVAVVIVGAGIPLEIPKIIDGLCQREAVEFTLHVQDTQSDAPHRMSFDPRAILGDNTPELPRPLFFPVVASATLASLMVKKTDGGVNGLILEEPTAGGHNAPPRGRLQLNESGEPVYGKRDEIKLEAIAALGVPFWLAGSYGSPEKLAEARAAGAAGVQIGTLFAFCEESGLRDDIKHDTITQCQQGTTEVFRDPVASPTGFPFQVLSVRGTLSESAVYSDRCRQCDLGYLREAYEKDDGSLGWRCPSEEPADYVRKGGKEEDTAGRKCLCNGLLANIGLGQIRSDGQELPLVTCGGDMSGIALVAGDKDAPYSATDVIDYLLAGSPA